MIVVTRLHGESIVINADEVLYVERTPDTTIVFKGGQRMMVRESPDELVERVIGFRRRIAQPLPEVRSVEEVDAPNSASSEGQ